MMMQPTTHNANKTRCAHPAVVRAVLRSRVCGVRLTKQTDGDNNVTQFIYGDQASGLNRLLARIIYPTLSQDLQYDQRDRITKSTDTSAGSALALDASPSQTTTNQYDATSNLTAVTDPATRTTATKYNGLGQITQTTDPSGGITQYGYDARGNLTSVTDAKGNIHRFAYDRLDRMVMEIRPLGQTISYAYDANGNLTQVTDPKGQIKRYTYDDANRRVQESHYLSAADLTTLTAVKTISYSYNVLDRLTGYNDGTTVGTYTYDTKQLRQTGQSVNYGSFTLATSTSYNALGQKSSITYPDGAQYSYTYDTNNQLSTVNFPAGFGSITINSYLWTVPSQITLPGGTVRTQQYDGLLRLKSLAVKDPGQSSVMNYQYGYDLTSNITSKATEAGTTNYSYDALDRLTAAAYTGTTQTNEAYSYDAVTNRITDSKTAAAVWTYDANNQLTQAGTISYTYDANGNTLSQTDSADAANSRNYVYDTDNRLIEVRDSSNALVAAYSYDPFGRRISKDAGASKTYFLYNEEGLIAEADATGVLTRSYGYAPGSTFSTNPLWMKTGTAYYTYQNDHLGTPMKLLSQSGAVVWSATYDAFGRATVNPASTITNNLRFPGQYYDQETGLHYNWMRFYDPQTGRYISSDPIGLEGAINLYGYAYGNPSGYYDPFGLFGMRDAIGLLPVVGSAMDAYDAFNCGNYGHAALNLGLAVLDATGVGALVKGLAVGTMRWSARKAIKEIHVSTKNWDQMRRELQKIEEIATNDRSIPRPDWETTDHIIIKQRSRLPHSITNHPANLQIGVPQSLNSKFEHMSMMDRMKYFPTWMKLTGAGILSYGAGLFVGSGSGCGCD
jgi:RHS repeat-associated protein